MSTTPPPATPAHSPTQHSSQSDRGRRRLHSDECVRDFACEPELLFVRHGPAEALQPVPCSGHQSAAFAADAVRCTFQHPPPAFRTRSPFDEPVMRTVRAPSPAAATSAVAAASCGMCGHGDRNGSPNAGGSASSADGQLDDIVQDDESSSGYEDADAASVALHSHRGESILDFVSGGKGGGEGGVFRAIMK